MLKKFYLFIIFILLLVITDNLLAFTLKSSCFAPNKIIPKQFTCDGENISPALHWKNIPNKTHSLVLIVSDPDTSVGIWTHWILFNIPANTNELKQDIKILPIGTNVGLNSWGNLKYEGPCPPDKMHRYYFTLYALDNELNLRNGATKIEVETAMKQHILGKTQLIGHYTRNSIK